MNLRWRDGRIAAAVLAGVVLVGLLGPPLANAVTNTVVIEGAGSTNKAFVTNSGLLGTLSFTILNGENLLVSSSSVANKSHGGVGLISGVSLDVVRSSGPVTIFLRKGTSPSGQIIWEGTLSGPGNIGYSFENGLFLTGGFIVTVETNTANNRFHYSVFGNGFGVKASSASRSVFGH